MKKMGSWHKTVECLPSRGMYFDLLDLQDETGRDFKGWYTGQVWDGYRYNGERIMMWKKPYYQ